MHDKRVLAQCRLVCLHHIHTPTHSVEIRNKRFYRCEMWIVNDFENKLQYNCKRIGFICAKAFNSLSLFFDPTERCHFSSLPSFSLSLTHFDDINKARASTSATFFVSFCGIDSQVEKARAKSKENGLNDGPFLHFNAHTQRYIHIELFATRWVANSQSWLQWWWCPAVADPNWKWWCWCADPTEYSMVRAYRAQRTMYTHKAI